MTDTGASTPKKPAAAARDWLLLRYIRLTRPSGMSLRRQLLVGLAVYGALLVLLVAAGINGSSMGLLYGEMYGEFDPRNVQGIPRTIRSDEWLIVVPLTVAQVEEGLPRWSGVVPGGFDASIVWDLPYREWSVLLRPHMWGFFFLPLDNAYALKWWLPFFIMAAALFVLLCTLWRRVVASLAVSGAFALSPFFMWWFGSGSFWPPACAIAACAGTVLMLRSDRAWVRWVIAALVAYLVAVAIIALYPPYLVPCLYPAIGFVVGWIFTARSLPWRVRLTRLIPLGVAAVVAVVVVGVYLVTRQETIDAVLSTVYPGQRLTPAGMQSFYPLAMYAGVLATALRAADLTGYAANSSEGSSFIFFGLYLLPSAFWLLWSRWRRGAGADWATVGVLASVGILAAFIYLPGWDALAHLMLLDRVTLPRIVIGLGLASILLLGLVVARLRELDGVRIPVWTTVAAVVLVLGTHVLVYVGMRDDAPAALGRTIAWLPLAIALAIAVGMFSRGRATVPGVLVALIALVVAGWVNPLYRGVFDLRETQLGQAIERVDGEDPGSWVATDTMIGAAALRESGVESYSGVQAWPSDEMWDNLDPDRSDEAAWNRYAHVDWTADPEAPPITLIATDAVQLRFDSCGAVAQEHIDHVLTEGPLDQPCVEEVERITEGTHTFYIFDVTPAP